MSARAMSSATVSFGLVSIPVKVYSTADSSKAVRFHWIAKATGSRLKQRYFDASTDEPVVREDMVKGYEYAKGQYVLFTEEELKALQPKASYSIDIAEFVPLPNVDPIYFEKSYYLGPDKGGDRPYRLLAEAMRESSRAALARYAARGKQYLVLLRPFEEGILMQQLRYADEIKAFSEVPIGSAEVKEQERTLARQLVDQIASDEFRPEDYEDETRKVILARIERKIEGQEVTLAPTEEPKAQIVDLMAALKASLGPEKAGKKGSKGRKPAKRAPKKPAAKKAARARSGKK